MKIFRILAMITVSLALFPWTGHAADENAEAAGIPAYSITRLKIYEGSAWVRTPDSGDWEEFSSNSPVPVRSLVSIPEGSEAELQFHGGQFVLLTAGTEISLLAVENERTAFGLRSGEIRFYLPETDFAPVSVTAPEGGRADFSVPGRYWLAAEKGGDATLVVREGEGTITVDRGAFPVKAGEQASFGKEVQIGKFEGGTRDSFEEPPPLSDAEKQAGVPPAAANELRDYGEWVFSSEYGYVWRPRVSSGWSPYYYGRWVWISPYGWTWVSYEPWGWYPYHYGYWYTDPVFGWVWYPFHSFLSFSFVFGHHHYPHYHGHAYYYPARVRFVRDGRNVRWVPLRPGERTGRIAYTRSDARLTSWERPLSRETVYVRGKGNRSGDWRDWTAVRRGGTVPARTRVAPRRNEAAPAVQSGGRGSPGAGGRGTDRSTRPQRERSPDIRETERPARDVPARQERWERIPPSSPRPERRSGVGADRSSKQTRTEKYGTPVPSRVPSPRAVVPSAARQRSSPGTGERVSIPRGGRAPAAPAPGREISRPAEPSGRGITERAPQTDSRPAGRSGGFRGNRSGSGGKDDFFFGSRGTGGGRGSRSVR
ncbi:MAG TPA: DUF6600 domain-containing protein [Candidatus Deferrimicrobiaceae bacterium]|nr:DUF6600 domain-containing protein [Candidatus Deferrimicrobiaceae bacterium]